MSAITCRCDSVDKSACPIHATAEEWSKGATLAEAFAGLKKDFPTLAGVRCSHHFEPGVIGGGCTICGMSSAAIAAERPPINHHRLGCHSRRGGACDCPPATAGGDEVSVTVVLPEPPAPDDNLPKTCAHKNLGVGKLHKDECLYCVDCRAAIHGGTKKQIHLNGVPVFLEPDWAVPTIESRGPVLPQHQHPLLGPDYIALATEIGKLVTEKQTAYGDSFGKSGAVLRILYPNGISLAQLDDALTITRILDKLFRIATDKDAFGESPFKDIVGYGLLAVARSKAGAR